MSANCTIDEYEMHREEYDGFCTQCGAWTREGDTEPDARDYPCPECECNTCIGAEEALIAGLIEIDD